MQVGDWVKADQTKLIELFSLFLQQTPVQMFVQRDIAFLKQNYGRIFIQKSVLECNKRQTSVILFEILI